MPDQDPIDVVRSVVEAFNASDWDRFRDLSAANVIYDEVATRRKTEGLDETLSLLQGWKVAMPDVTGTVDDVVASGNVVTAQITWDGTQTGPLESPGGTIPASGKRQVTPSCWVLKVEGGQVQSSRHYFDMVTLLEQIGALPIAQEQG
jgi:steroid delta-isomerase-like uncharacterized protein